MKFRQRFLRYCDVSAFGITFLFLLSVVTKLLKSDPFSVVETTSPGFNRLIDIALLILFVFSYLNVFILFFGLIMSWFEKKLGKFIFYILAIVFEIGIIKLSNDFELIIGSLKGIIHHFTSL
ncbi:hypothetical protein [Xanthocytophaga flava]|uniref:hypothetical protein n=1 Tax=Xanthocytophaga flava TaxID=3048013 RepID=UPI0028D5F0C6|nr:hypothetical protein [Xanthocytophaga flavus]MDJ1469283.1 hypothetical protein [Xanthocytophaga flavus]